MNEPLISLIIPVYNQEELLGKCLDSVVSQKYRNIEVIVVDDGSTDRSGMICDDYARRDDRIKVYHQKNMGISGARNTGLSHVHGEYVAFVDSDDAVSEEYVSYMYRLLTDNESEIVICDFCKDLKGDKPFILTGKVTNMTGEELCFDRLKNTNRTTNVLYSKLISIRLIRNIVFPNVPIAEDLSVIFKILYPAEKITISSAVIYRYFVGNISAMRTDFAERNIICTLKARKAIYDYFVEVKNQILMEMAYRMYFEKLLIAYSLIIDGAIDGDIYDLKKQIKNEIREAYPVIRKMGVRNKINSFDFIKVKFKFFVGRYFSFTLRFLYGKKYIHRF